MLRKRQPGTKAWPWGWGMFFLLSLDAKLQNMRRTPKAFPLFHGSYRRAFVRRFPYCVFFDSVGSVYQNLQRGAHITPPEHCS